MAKIPISLHVKSKATKEVDKILKRKDELQQLTAYKKISQEMKNNEDLNNTQDSNTKTANNKQNGDPQARQDQAINDNQSEKSDSLSSHKSEKNTSEKNKSEKNKSGNNQHTQNSSAKTSKNLKQMVSKEKKLLEKQLEKFLSDTLLKTNSTDHKLLTNKLYKDNIKIDNPQATLLTLHTQVLLQPWNYSVVDNEIYFRILSILNANLDAKNKNLSAEELLAEIQGKNQGKNQGKMKGKIKDKNQENNHGKNQGKNQHKNHKANKGKESINDEQEPNHNEHNNGDLHKNKDKDSLEDLEGLAFIQWLSAISDENTNELNDFLQRMRIFKPLEFFQRVQNISTNVNLFVDNNGQIKVTNFHKDKKLIEQELNNRGRLRSHIWEMVGFDYNKQGLNV